MENSNNELLKLSQQIILNFLRKNIADESKINQIKNFLEKFPVSQNETVDEFLKSQSAVAEVGNTPDGKKMFIRTDVNTSIEGIMTVIHEYAHAFSAEFSPSDQKLGILEINTILEEGMAVNFSEACINEWIKDTKMFEENKNGIVEDNSIYAEERSIVNTILLALNKKGLDNKAMIEYLLGDKEEFLSLCKEELGESFSESFSIIENEISVRSKFPKGVGFREREDIEEIYNLVSNKLSNIISEEILAGLSEDDNDLTKDSNRYLKTNQIFQIKYAKEFGIKNVVKDIINSGEFSVEECNDFLKYIDKFNFEDFEEFSRTKRLFDKGKLKPEVIKSEISIIEEWKKETGYTIEQLNECSANFKEKNELFWKYHIETGEKLDRKSRTDEFIQKRLQLKYAKEFGIKNVVKDIINSGEFSVEECNDFLKYIDKFNFEDFEEFSRTKRLFDKGNLKPEVIKSEISIIEEWKKETGYTIEQLYAKEFGIKNVVKDIINSGEFSVEECNDFLKYIDKFNFEDFKEFSRTKCLFDKGNLKPEVIKSQISIIEEWKKETGYTIEQLNECSANFKEKDELFWKYHTKTGEKLDRKSRTDEFMQKRLQLISKKDDVRSSNEEVRGRISLSEVERTTDGVHFSTINNNIDCIRQNQHAKEEKGYVEKEDNKDIKQE